MNKTVTINISGIIFHIEEDAYESLNQYLAAIKGYFSRKDAGNEIMMDIEARIAELLQLKLSSSKQVILLSDVDDVKQVMGKPEDFGAEPENTSANQSNLNQESFQDNEKIKRRLYRNPDEKAIGGVCSGLAAYFDVDIVWVRLAMFLLIFFGGLSLWVYIIIPEAKTTADKLAMKGEAANVNTIFKSFKEEAEDLKNRANKFGDSVKNQNYGERVRTNVSYFLVGFFNVVGRLFGLFLVIVGCALLLAYIASLTGITIANSSSDIQHWKMVVFESPGIYALAVLAFILVVGIPVFMLLYAGVKLLFRIHYINKWINRSLGLIWILGIILASYVAVITIKQFTESSRTKQIVELSGIGDTIVVKMNPGIEIINSMRLDNEDDMENYLNKNHSGYTFLESNKETGIVGFADLNVTESEDDSIVMIINQSARGTSKKDANENARAIRYAYKINKNEIIFDQLFFVEQGLKFRGQEVDIKLKLPKGKVIYFDKSVKYLLNDIDNTTNTWDGDMISRRWQMTEKGLKCIDCDNLTSVEEHDEVKNNGIEINADGIKVKDKETQISISEEGIKIKDKNERIKIDEDGVEVKSNKGENQSLPEPPSPPKEPK
jgi:phage shock protein PspC (stress-responsive transcriptional regulator)